MVIYFNLLISKDPSKFNKGEWLWADFRKLIEDFGTADIEIACFFFSNIGLLLPKRVVIGDFTEFFDDLNNLERYLRRENLKSKKFIMKNFEKTVDKSKHLIENNAKVLVNCMNPKDINESNNYKATKVKFFIINKIRLRVCWGIWILSTAILK